MENPFNRNNMNKLILKVLKSKILAFKGLHQKFQIVHKPSKPRPHKIKNLSP